MSGIVIVVSPAFGRRGERRHGRFDVRLKDNDDDQLPSHAATVAGCQPGTSSQGVLILPP